jgi:hypothetical protein
LPNRDDDDDDNPYDERDEEGSGDEDTVDLDMLPTMLVYRDGDLVHNWVRVDWEAGRAGIEELLDKLVIGLLSAYQLYSYLPYRHHILPRSDSILGGTNNLGLPSDDEDDFDLLWSDDEDIDHR